MPGIKKTGSSDAQPTSPVANGDGTLIGTDWSPADAARAGVRSRRKRRESKKSGSSSPNPTPQGASAEHASDFYESDRKVNRVKTIVLLIVLVVLVVYSLTLSYGYTGTANMTHYSLGQVATALWTAIQITASHLFGFSLGQSETKMIQDAGMYYDEISRLQVTLMVLFGGLLVSVSGMLFQIVFRNPIASPTILGISSGVSIGKIIAVLIFGTGALRMLGWDYVLSFCGGLITLAIVLLVGKVTGGGKGSFAVHNMIIVGAMMSQLFGVIINVATTMLFSGTLSDTYNLLALSNPKPSLFALSILAIVTIVSMVPIITGRFKYNVLSLPDEEMKLSGFDPGKTRVLVLACGSLMILAAQATVGSITILSLVVPFLARALYGVEFRRQLLGSVLIGMSLMLACNVVACLIPFVGDGVSMETIANVITVPLFAWIMAANQKALGE